MGNDRSCYTIFRFPFPCADPVGNLNVSFLAIDTNHFPYFSNNSHHVFTSGLWEVLDFNVCISLFVFHHVNTLLQIKKFSILLFNNFFHCFYLGLVCCNNFIFVLVHLLQK
uniref:Uncharacterized protein n=1 Tax=Cacopsylla melanoneura TaxID=428564 RepID=A0A8D8TMD9_9HEMI